VLRNQLAGDISVTKTIRELSTQEAEFLSRLSAAGQTIFSTAQAREFWGNADYTVNVLNRLARKGWLQRLERGVYMVIPLEAGPQRDWSESALVIAPHLIQPAAVAYWSALHYWNMTEQVPHTVFVQSTRRKRPVEILGMRFHFVSVSQTRFFGVARRTLDGKPIYVTDREKTLLDAAARPDLSGGIEQLAQALHVAWANLDWARLDDYLIRWGGGVVVKRFGYLIEALSLPVPDLDHRLERWQGLLSQGVSLLEPAAQAEGPVITRWRIRVNVAVTTPGRNGI
jgi:predicted transcriptional regulator of viral defense system